MLDKVVLENYRCFRDRLAVVPRPLTVLIGQNDTGKSVFMGAIMKMLGSASFSKDDWWRKKTPALLEIQVDGHRCQYNLGQGRTATISGTPPHLRAVLVRLPSSGIAMTSKGIQEEVGAHPEVSADGGNIAAILDYLLRQDRVRFDALEKDFANHVPGVTGIRIRTPSPDSRSVDLNLHRDFTIAGEESSTGVRVILFYLMLAHVAHPPDLLLIEEPETGVHPKRLEAIVRVLHELTVAKEGRKASQVILTTHSPYLLDYINLEMDQVVVFQRKEDGSRTAKAVKKDDLNDFLSEFMLGEVWFNRGEQGLVGSGESTP